MGSNDRAAVLDGELEDILGTYDDILRDERERAQGSGSGEAGGDPGTGPDGGGGAGGPQEFQVPNQPESAGGSGGGSGEPRQSFPPPDDIPSGRDDDVVARQLREAAMTEADPELREALWDEYRNYTGLGNR